MTMHINNDNEPEKPASAISTTDVPDAGCEETVIKDDINRLCVKSREGLWGLFIFLLASIVIFYFPDQGLTSSLEPDFRESLGPAPPLFLVNILMWVSIFSSLVLIGGRVYHGWVPGSTWTHLFFRLLFYLLYFVVDSLSDYYHAVFISGLVVLALQHYNIWSYASKAISTRLTVGENLAVWQRRMSGE